MLRPIPIMLFLIAMPSFAGELCIDQSTLVPCPPADIAIAFTSTGFTTDGDPCTTVGYETDFCSISSSPTDPHVNVGPIPDDLRLYLWIGTIEPVRAAAGYGYNVGVVEITETDLSIASFQPEPGNSGEWDPDSDSTFYELPCISYYFPMRVGTILLEANTASDAESWGRIKTLYR